MKYILLNTRRTKQHGITIWWNKGHRGYTNNIHRAHIFTKEEAKKKCANSDKSDAYSMKDFIDCESGIVTMEKLNQCTPVFRHGINNKSK